MHQHLLAAAVTGFAIVITISTSACTPSRTSTEASGSTPVPTTSAKEAPTQQTPVPASTMVGRVYFSTAGAPDPLACTADSECIGDTVTRDDGCCVMSSEALPQTWAWHTWLSTRRMSPICKAITCPPAPSPSMPAACTMKVKCVAGKCKNSCPTAG